MTDKKITLTREGKDKLQAELDELKKQKRPAVIERIKRAKEFGDLSENAEYEDARNEQSFIEGRIQEIEYVLKYAQIVESKGSSEVGLGSRVKIEMDGDKLDYELVGSSEANPSAGKISGESPIGMAIIGKKKGDKFTAQTPGGKISIKVLEIK
jgi:transcription elongation factor GreA